MKFLRLILLVSMAVLLPVRGVVAATMQCAPASSAVVAAMNDHGEQQHDDAAHAHHASHDTAHDGLQHETHHDGKHDRCPACATGCCMPSLTSPPPAWNSADAAPAAGFPPIDLPALSFVSSGPERPPRTV